MNNDRRAAIRKLANTLETYKDELENIVSDEEENRDNIPENLQGSERYDKADTACKVLNEALESLEDVISCLEAAAE